MTLPQYSAGQYGALSAEHLNRAFRIIDRLNGDGGGATGDRGERDLFVISVNGPANPAFPMLALWNPVKLDFDGARLIEWPEEAATGFAGTDDATAALFALPPVAMAFVRNDGQGRARAIAFPAVSVVEGNVISSAGNANPTYSVVSADGMFSASGVTPLDRTPGLLYSARPDQFCLLVLRQNASGAPDVRMLGFEPFATEKCKSTAAASGPLSPTFAQRKAAYLAA